MASIERKLARVSYYARNILRDLAPQSFFRRRLQGILDNVGRYDVAKLAQRVGYYNKLSGPLDLAQHSATVARIPMGKSLYYYDLKEHARYFPRNFRFDHIFMDLNIIPSHPSFVKSRPIAGDNRNSILLNLDKFRHFHFPADPVAFRDKKPVAVWRGGAHNQRRALLLQRHLDHPLCDVGQTDENAFFVREGGPLRPFLSIKSLMQFRYVISIEGFDVATNLKWILASNCLCLMPAPTCETWFMEGRLEAGVHYVPLRDDFADLEEKILYYERNIHDALAIIGNANGFAAQFRDKTREQLLSILVMYKFFVLTGQLKAHDRILDIVSPR